GKTGNIEVVGDALIDGMNGASGERVVQPGVVGAALSILADCLARQAFAGFDWLVDAGVGLSLQKLPDGARGLKRGGMYSFEAGEQIGENGIGSDIGGYIIFRIVRPHLLL